MQKLNIDPASYRNYSLTPIQQIPVKLNHTYTYEVD